MLRSAIMKKGAYHENSSIIRSSNYNEYETDLTANGYHVFCRWFLIHTYFLDGYGV